MTDKQATLKEAEAKAREIGRLLKGAMPVGWSFVLVLASDGDGGDMTYLSNCERTSAIALMRELATKIEKEPT